MPETPLAGSYVRFKGHCWQLGYAGPDVYGRLCLISLQDHSTGISADPKDIRPCTEAEIDGIEYFLKSGLPSSTRNAD